MITQGLWFFWKLWKANQQKCRVFQTCICFWVRLTKIHPLLHSFPADGQPCRWTDEAKGLPRSPAFPQGKRIWGFWGDLGDMSSWQVPLVLEQYRWVSGNPTATLLVMHMLYVAVASFSGTLFFRLN